MVTIVLTRATYFNSLTLRVVTLAVALAGVVAPPGARAQEVPHAVRHRLLVISVDGLDWRYLKNADRLGLRIPHIRRLLAEGDVADGVVGESPTITWPSHTTLITGVPPRVHGILGNRRPASEGGDYYADASLVKVPTLWRAAKAAGLTIGAVTWPVTVTPEITFNLPEYSHFRQSGAMDLASIEAKATPKLIDRISARYPSFPQQWLDDRARTLAALYMTRDAGADLTLLHFIELDDAEHEAGPFTRSANAVLEHTDELIGELIRDIPKDLNVALVSDHGFERVDRVLSLSAWLAGHGLLTWMNGLMSLLPYYEPPDHLIVSPGLVATHDAALADALARDAALPGSPIGRRVPRGELARWAPELEDVAGAFEPAEHVVFTHHGPSRALYSTPSKLGDHQFWPGRADYRAVYLLWGHDVLPQCEPEISMLEIAARLAKQLGLPPMP
ncbi:MAG: ectonucleotide pyrophosphatase/phosphodiesterase [Acidobacteriota bacterium]